MQYSKVFEFVNFEIIVNFDLINSFTQSNLVVVHRQNAQLDRELNVDEYVHFHSIFNALRRLYCV